MDCQKFLQLSQLYKNWGQLTVSPQSEQFQLIIAQLEEKVSPNFLHLLNFAVHCLENEEIYCQIGCTVSAHLIGSLINQSDKIAYGVDANTELETLIEHLCLFNLEEQVLFCQQHEDEFFFDLRSSPDEVKIGVYFINGSVDYRSQLLRLLLVKPFLAARAIIIINNSNYSGVQQANYDFLATHHMCQLGLELPTATFGDDLTILFWDINQVSNHSRSDFQAQLSHQPFIQSLSQFQQDFEFNYKPKVITQLCQEGLSLATSGNLTEAQTKFLQVLSWDKNHHLAWHNLGIIYYQTSQWQNAYQAVFKAVSIDHYQSVYYYTLGLILEKLAQKDKAIEAYQQAISLNPQEINAYNNLGNIFAASSELDVAESIFRQAIANYGDHLGTYINLVNLLLEKQQYQEAIALCEKCLEIPSTDVEPFFLLINNLRSFGLIEAAINLTTQAAAKFPDDLGLKLEKYRLIPIIYDQADEIDLYRQRFSQYVDKLTEISLESSESKRQGLKLISRHTNFYLQYQGKDDLELQKKYGEFVVKAMSANYPHWSKKLTMPPLTSSGKIRVGYISSSMCHHVVGILSLGWFINHNHDQLEIYCYYCKKFQSDFMTEEFKKYSDVFYQNTFDLEAICQQIIEDKLHILVFLDLGMEPEMTQLAGLRLAPIQCTTWLHPVTSGLPSIDYFISNQAMEAANGDEHYSEKLIRLPFLGICYPQPSLPESRETRAKFQLSQERIIYLSSQTLSKYLPQYDYIFPTIAQQVPKALFVFCQSHVSQGITEKFRQRLQKSFAEFNLESQDYCLILPRLSHADYFQLNFLSDIFLDTFSWSGGYSSLDAIATNLPIVTLSGEFLRGRQSEGILSILGITETIAHSFEEYIDIAVKLGKNCAWREAMVAKIEANSYLLYDQQAGLDFLEEFYRNLV